ncbi:hypothetical protein [Hydrogenophaga sp.]|nr:hypothetical protein [Hydrogenophaga sp.]
MQKLRRDVGQGILRVGRKPVVLVILETAFLAALCFVSMRLMVV